MLVGFLNFVLPAVCLDRSVIGQLGRTRTSSLGWIEVCFGFQVIQLGPNAFLAGRFGFEEMPKSLPVFFQLIYARLSSSFAKTHLSFVCPFLKKMILPLGFQAHLTVYHGRVEMFGSART